MSAVAYDPQVLTTPPLNAGMVFANKEPISKEEEILVAHILKNKPVTNERRDEVTGEVLGNKYAIRNIILALNAIDTKKDPDNALRIAEKYNEIFSVSMFYTFSGGIPLREATPQEFAFVTETIRQELTKLIIKKNGSRLNSEEEDRVNAYNVFLSTTEKIWRNRKEA